MTLTLTILGCGNSTGVPAVLNRWGVCDPDEPRNRRLRSSVAVQSAATTLVVDTGPDFREQVNQAGITDIDAILYTHAHSDHVHGIDDLRMISIKKGDLVPVYGSGETLDELKDRFDYLFKGGAHEIYKPMLAANRIAKKDYGKLRRAGDIDFIPFAQDHGSCVSTGYRFGNCAYSVDMIDLSVDSIRILQDIEVWIVDCAAYKEQHNSVHANLEKIFALNEQIGARRVILTSLSLAMDYRTLLAELPGGYEPAYDGLVLEIKGF